MIYTLTLNPSIDYYVTVDAFLEGTTMRTRTECMKVGGKGINVSLMLKNLGIASEAILCVAGFTGAEIINQLGKKGISADPIYLEEGNSRINVKLKSHLESEVNGMGPKLTEASFASLLEKLAELTENDVLVLSGSMPASVSSEQFRELLELLKKKRIPFVADLSGSRLLQVLPYHPLLVKPNMAELNEIFGVELKEISEISEYAVRLREMGAQNVMVSLGDQGGILAVDDMVYITNAPEGEPVSTVGAGDSMVAGFLAAGDRRGKNLLRFCVACGSASAFSHEFATLEEVEELIQRGNSNGN